eukprot:7560450-Pyramimonas_sp.AAC.2
MMSAASFASCLHTARDMLRSVMLRPPLARLSPARKGSRCNSSRACLAVSIIMSFKHPGPLRPLACPVKPYTLRR